MMNSMGTRARRRMVAAGSSLVAVVLGLGLAEVGFSRRDAGAFPQLNCFVADSALGARLLPGCSTAIRFGSDQNPVTHVVIAADGFRSAPPSTEGADEVLVVGDSQAFGLGVEAGETFSARLEQALGAAGNPVHVRNLGVPTYGPDEYLAVAEAAIAKKKPKTLVVAINLANDLFEASRPNVTRHTVADGWAIRAEQIAKGGFTLGGPISRRSHLLYAFRRWTHASADRQGTPSEGDYAELVTMSGENAKAEEAARLDYERALRLNTVEAMAAYDTLVVTERALDAKLTAAVQCHDPQEGDFPCATLFPEQRPGDYVERFHSPSENARPTRVTAEQLHRASLLRAYQDDNAKAIEEVERVVPSLKPLAVARSQARTKFEAITGQRPTQKLPPTPLSPALARLGALAKAQGIRVVVAVVPIDVVVSPTEWKKYDVTGAPDVSAVEEFGAALSARAKAEGLLAVDLTEPLRKGLPGVFLDRDIHLTPKGHQIMADTLAPLVLAGAPAPEEAKSALPRALDRHFVKGHRELHADYNLRHGACTTMGGQNSGFFTSACPVKPGSVWLTTGNAVTGDPAALDALNLDENEFVVGKVDGQLLFAAPLRVSRPVFLVLTSAKGSRGLVAMPIDYGVQFEEVTGMPAQLRAPLPISVADDAYVACAKARPNDALAPADPDCSRTYADSCELLLACTRGAPVARPRCQPGFVNVAPSGRCFASCDAGPGACSQGRSCVVRQGASVCLRTALPAPVPDYRKVIAQWGTVDVAKESAGP